MSSSTAAAAAAAAETASSATIPLERFQALQMIHQAMASVPESDKKEYLQALQMAPHLVLKESDPLKFLCFCEYNAWSAIARLCNYWRERKALFGERAFLPMTMDGNGALKKEDILVLEAGYPAVLPETQNGRSVLFCDRSKWLPSSNSMNLNRAAFYVVTLLCMTNDKVSQPASQGGGLLIIVDLIQPRLIPFDFDYLRRQSRNFSSAYPTFSELHGFCTFPRSMRGEKVVENGLRVSKQAYVAHLLSFAYEVSQESFKVSVHFEVNQDDIRKRILELGCAMEGIPTCYGGKLTFLQMQKWCHLIVFEESAGEEECTSSTVAESLAHPALTAVASSTYAANQAPQGTWTADRKRSVNALHSRKKRQRRKQELDSMEQEKIQLQESNAKLRAEQKGLQSLLAQAQELAAAGGAGAAATKAPASTATSAETCPTSRPMHGLDGQSFHDDVNLVLGDDFSISNSYCDTTSIGPVTAAAAFDDDDDRPATPARRRESSFHNDNANTKNKKSDAYTKVRAQIAELGAAEKAQLLELLHRPGISFGS
mmetsp:Transcript_28602/g.78570  ORF Transcript_28602/g.78570 Transcript_28602/m.78570 type:complete len:542 (-) Transcript_28602:75-1700(-)